MPAPVEAISLVIGTEKRGVDLPHVNENFETNVPGIYIAGELGGMGLIKNSVEQGQGAVEYMVKKWDSQGRGLSGSCNHRCRTCRNCSFTGSKKA